LKSRKFSLAIGIVVVMSLTFGSMIFGAKSVKSGVASEYYPLNPGNVWTYKRTTAGETNLFKIKVTEPENENSKIIVYYPNGNPRSFVYYSENRQGIFKTKEMGEGGVFEYHPLWQVLSSSMKIGATWSWESGNNKMKETARVVAAEEVTVPAGTFNTLLVEYKGVYHNGVPYTDKTWYAKGVGYVKDEFTIAGQTILSELHDYQLTK
jgi:hypothetical protein